MSEKYWINRDFVLSNGMTVGEALDHPGYPHEPDKYDWYTIPGSTLEEMLEERNMTVSDCAQRCQLPAADIRGVIKGDVAITETIAAGLEKGGLGTRQFWLNRQRNYERKKARVEKKRQAQKQKLRPAAAL